MRPLTALISRQESHGPFRRIMGLLYVPAGDSLKGICERDMDEKVQTGMYTGACVEKN